MRPSHEAKRAFRGPKNYKRSDELRAELERKYGIRVKDTKDGTRWERIRRKGA